MRRLVIAALLLAAFVATALVAPRTHWFKEAFMNEPAYQANRLFHEEDPNYDPAIHKLAQEIEWDEAVPKAAFAALGDKINQRHGEQITLLFHAVASGNVAAVDALLAAGADTSMVDKLPDSSRNFVYYLTLPGGPLLDMDGITRMIGSYLKHGGDPNGSFGPPQNVHYLAGGLALNKNLKGLRMVLDAGGDPWRYDLNEGELYGNAMTNLAADSQVDALDDLIDAGYFDAVPLPLLQDFMGNLGMYAQRRDQRSKDIQRIAKRVLKRNPDYVESPTSETGTTRIFKDHWQDPAPGVIPWDEILSDSVK